MPPADVAHEGDEQDDEEPATTAGGEEDPWGLMKVPISMV